MIELPSPAEAFTYQANNLYLDHLIKNLGDGSGLALESIARYLLSCMPGCKALPPLSTLSSNLDVVCSMEGFEVDFRSELGRYFVCECKDWKRKADFATIAKFCRVLDSVKARFGILFSKKGISGAGKARYAEREQMKVYQDRGMIIVVIDEEDLKRVVHGDNFIGLLRSRYEKVRLDLDRKR